MLIAVDLAERSEDIIRRGTEMFAGGAGPVQFVLAHVICSFDQLLSPYLCAKPGPDLQSALAIEAKARLAELGNACVETNSSSRREVILTGAPWKQLLTAVQTHRCQAVVLGQPLNRDSSSRLLGSTVERMLLDSPCPVVVLPARD